MHDSYTKVARTIVRLRFVIVLVWILGAVVAIKALPSMTSEVNNDNSQFLASSAPSSRAASLAAPILGNINATSQLIVIDATRHGPLNKLDERAITAQITALRRVKDVAGAKVAKLSPTGTAAQILVTTRLASSDIQHQKTVVKHVETALARLPASHALITRLAGPVATNVANQESSSKTTGRIQSLSILLIIVLLLLILRAPLAALVTLIPPALALVVSERFIGGLGANGLQISIITDILMIVLLLGAGTDYGLFLVFRVREALRDGQRPRDAVAYALVRVGESISGSAGTVILALLTLLFATFGMYHDLAVPLALAMAVMLLAGLTLLPALLAIFGTAAFWPVRVRAHPNRDGWWGKIGRQVVRRPRVTLGVGVLVFLALAAAALGYRSAGFGGATAAPAGSSVAQGNQLLAAHFPRSSANPSNLVFAYRTSVWQHPQPIVTAERTLAASGEFRAIQGPLDPNGTPLTATQLRVLHAQLGAPGRLPTLEPPALHTPAAQYNAYRATAQFVSTSGLTMQLEAGLRAGPQKSTAAMNATPSIRRAVSRAASDSGARAAGVAGEAAALYDVSAAANHDLGVVVPIAIVAIGVLLALILRSLIAPIYLVVSVGLSYLAALGASTLLFIDLGGESGLTFLLPFLMFVFLLALGEDYNILMMTRMREENDHRTLRDAVSVAVGRTGPTITSAGIILAGSFFVIGFAGGGGSGGSQIQDIGYGLAIGILMDTFVVRTLLVPSVAILLGRWNWWPAHTKRQPHDPGPRRHPELQTADR